MLCALCTALCFGGCAQKNNTEAETLGENVYRVYFINSEKNELLSHTVEITAGDDETVIYKLCSALKDPKWGSGEISVFNGDVQLNNFIINDRVLQLYFSDDYYSMNNIAEIMFRSAIVKTVSQISSIDYVMFYVADQPLKNQSGSLVGLMNGSSFINDVEDELESVKWIDTTLYYADSTGTLLCGEKIQLAYTQGTPIEQVIVEKLIKGSDLSECRNAVSSSVKILGVNIKDGVCYVNFDGEFLSGVVDVSPEVTIYSIVNSLCELKNVNKVQILVNGSYDCVFRDTFNLSSAYERNLDLISQVYVNLN